MKLSNYTQTSVVQLQPGSDARFIVSGIGSLKGVWKGRGALFSGIQPDGKWSAQFSFLESGPTVLKTDDFGTVAIGTQNFDRFPCSGFVSMTNEGYVIAPSFRLQPQNGKEMVLMLISPAIIPHQVSVNKTIVNLPDGETVSISTWQDEVRFLGTISENCKASRIVLNRNPKLPVYERGFDQSLGETKSGDQISVVWKAIGRNFEEQLLVFDPFHIDPVVFDDLLDSLNAPDDEYLGVRGDFVIGDGEGVDYKIRLILNRGLGRHFTDETNVVVT